MTYINCTLNIKVVVKTIKITIPGNSLSRDNIINLNNVDIYEPVGIVGIYNSYPASIFPTVYYINKALELHFRVGNTYSQSLETEIALHLFYDKDTLTVSVNDY